ncbi:MAG: phosphonoacetaldehyde reductase [Pelagibacteraceae bacterium]
MRKFSFSSTEDLSVFLKNEKNKKILIICGEKSYKTSGAEKLISNLLANQNTQYFYKKFSYPDLPELKQIISFIKKFSPEMIISVGGGSVLDYAKIANVLTDSSDLENEIVNSSYKTNKKFAKLIAIPTTAGSGAEVTSNAVIYINKKKYSVEGPYLRPDFFFLIPELVIGASNKIKSSSGFDAIAQAMESLISKKSNEKSLEFAKKSLTISLKYYLDFLKKPNLENTAAMCLAANLSGEAISISKTTAPHAVSYPFTSIYNISHGHAVSLTINKFLRFNFENLEIAKSEFNLKKRYQIMFDLSKSDNINSFDKYLTNLKKEANLENNYSKLGINIKNDYSKIISGVNILRLANNPVELKEEDLKKIIQS